MCVPVQRIRSVEITYPDGVEAKDLLDRSKIMSNFDYQYNS